MKLDPESLRNQSFAQTTANEDDVACEFGPFKGVVRGQLLCNRDGIRWKKAEFMVQFSVVSIYVLPIVLRLLVR